MQRWEKAVFFSTFKGSEQHLKYFAVGAAAFLKADFSGEYSPQEMLKHNYRVNITRYYDFVKAMAPLWCEDGTINYETNWIPLPIQWEVFNQQQDFKSLPVDPSRPYLECFEPV